LIGGGGAVLGALLESTPALPGHCHAPHQRARRPRCVACFDDHFHRRKRRNQRRRCIRDGQRFEAQRRQGADQLCILRRLRSARLATQHEVRAAGRVRQPQIDGRHR
jgi:hypothetical protein